MKYTGLNTILNKFEKDFAYQLYKCYEDVHISSNLIVEVMFSEDYRLFTKEDEIAWKNWLKYIMERPIYKLSFEDQGKEIKHLTL